MQEKLDACKAYILENYQQLDSQARKNKMCHDGCDQMDSVEISFQDETLEVTYMLYDYDDQLGNFQLQYYDEELQERKTVDICLY